MEQKEFPEEDDIVIGTVNNVIGTSVFVKLEDYGKEGVISFSEVAPGRIRNIRDYIRPNQKIVCKVLRIDREKAHIDLSLRRVTSKEKKEILEKYQKEKEMFAVLDIIIKDQKRADDIGKGLKQKSDFVELCSNIASDAKSCQLLLKDVGFSDEEAGKFVEIIKEKVKVKKAVVKSKFTVSSDASDGIERIKKLLVELESKGSDISYIGAPNYMITLEDKDYKEANRRLREMLDFLALKAKEYGFKFEIEKEK